MTDNKKVPSLARGMLVKVAQAAGVSTTTVSNVLKDKGNVSEDTRYRVAVALQTVKKSTGKMTRKTQKILSA